MNKKSKLLLLLFICIVLLLIFGGYYLSTHLNKSLTSSSAPTAGPTAGPTPKKGYLCDTCEEGKSLTFNAPPGTHFTKFLFADYGNPSGCENPSYGSCSIQTTTYEFQNRIGKNPIPCPDPCSVYVTSNPNGGYDNKHTSITNLKTVTIPANFTYMGVDPCWNIQSSTSNTLTVSIEYEPD